MDFLTEKFGEEDVERLIRIREEVLEREKALEVASLALDTQVWGMLKPGGLENDLDALSEFIHQVPSGYLRFNLIQRYNSLKKKQKPEA